MNFFLCMSCFIRLQAYRHLPLHCGILGERSIPMLVLVTISAVAFGRAGESWSEAFGPGSKLQKLVDDAVRTNVSTLALPSGNFSFSDASLVINKGTGLKIEGSGVGTGGTALWFDPGYGIELLDCRDVSLSGLSTDLLTPPNSQGALVFVSQATNQIIIDVERGFPLLDEELFNQQCPDRVGICGEVKTIFWDPTTRRIVQGQPMGMPMASATCNHQTRRCRVTLRAKISWVPPPGSLVTLSPRFGATKYPIPSFYRGHILVYRSSRVTLSDIDTYSSATMTILENLGGGGHTCVSFYHPNSRVPGAGMFSLARRQFQALLSEIGS